MANCISTELLAVFLTTWYYQHLHWCVGHTAWAPVGREGRSQAGPKGHWLEVGARRAPKLLVNLIKKQNFLRDYVPRGRLQKNYLLKFDFNSETNSLSKFESNKSMFNISQWWFQTETNRWSSKILSFSSSFSFVILSLDHWIGSTFRLSQLTFNFIGWYWGVPFILNFWVHCCFKTF